MGATSKLAIPASPQLWCPAVALYEHEGCSHHDYMYPSIGTNPADLLPDLL